MKLYNLSFIDWFQYQMALSETAKFSFDEKPYFCFYQRKEFLSSVYKKKHKNDTMEATLVP